MKLSNAQGRQSIAARLEVIQLQMWRLEKAMRDLQSDLETVLNDVTVRAEDPFCEAAVALPSRPSSSLETDFAPVPDAVKTEDLDDAYTTKSSHTFEDAFSASVMDLFETTRPPAVCANHDAATDVELDCEAAPTSGHDHAGARASKLELRDLETGPAGTESSPRDLREVTVSPTVQPTEPSAKVVLAVARPELPGSLSVSATNDHLDAIIDVSSQEHQDLDFAHVTVDLIGCSFESAESHALDLTGATLVAACGDLDDDNDDRLCLETVPVPEIVGEISRLDEKTQALVATVVGLSEAEPRASEPAEPRKRSFVKTAAGLAASIVIA
ncbi:MAG: hypothetical protein ACR2PA_27245, partial [Hyphomicrobiaceae bacterium]